MMRMCFKEETTSNLMIDQCLETQVKVFETIKIIGKEIEDGEMKWVFRGVIFEEGVDLVKIEEIQPIEEVDFGSQQLSQIILLARVCLVQEEMYLSKESLNLKLLTTVMDRDQFKDFKQEVQVHGTKAMFHHSMGKIIWRSLGFIPLRQNDHLQLFLPNHLETM